MFALKTNTRSNKNNRLGLITIGSGVLSVLGPSVIFVPLTLIMSVFIIFKGQIFWGVIGLFLAFTGFLTSPTLIGIASLGWLWATIGWFDSFTPNLHFFYDGRDI